MKLGLINCARGKHTLKEFNAGRINIITKDVEVYHECIYCRFYCYIKQLKSKHKTK